MRFYTILFFMFLGGGIGLLIHAVTPKVHNYKPYSSILKVKKTQSKPGYVFIYSGKDILINGSFREKSLSGGFRGRGPRAGK